MIESQHYTENFYTGQQDGSLSSAKAILPIVRDAINPSSVIDIGCGVGYWLSVWLDWGITDIMGVEGPYVKPDMLKVPKERVLFQDLKNPLLVKRKFDLAMSLEVAEHLPTAFSDEFVLTLCNLSDVVLFSAAIPGQEGTYHINEQVPEFWAEKFKKNGFVAIDFIRDKVWNLPQVEWWYQQNVILYVKESSLHQFPALQTAFEQTKPSSLFRVHPWIYFYHYRQKKQMTSVLGYFRWKLYPLKKWITSFSKK